MRFIPVVLVLSCVLAASCSNSVLGSSSSSYSVLYRGNDSSNGKAVPTDGNAYSAGATVTVLGNLYGIARTGYSFTGWNTLAAGTGTHYDVGETFQIGSSDVVLYADWDADADDPDAVTDLQAVTGDGKITLTWTDPTGTGFSSIVVSGSALAAALPIAKGTETCVITGLTNGTAYTFTLTVCDSSNTTLSTSTVSGFAYAFSPDLISVHGTTTGFSMGSAETTVVYSGYDTSGNISTTTDTMIPVHTVSGLSDFSLASTELSYGEWYAVRTWAEAQGYTFKHKGCAGFSGVSGAVPDGDGDLPVTTISWYDALVWCNAASEMEGLTPCYYSDAAHTVVLKASSVTTAFTSDCVAWTANGYRLPTEAEWEYAARYINGSSWYPGNYASGGDAAYNATSGGADCDGDGDIDYTAAVANIDSDYLNDEVHYDAVSVGLYKANSLGLHDMSGNVSEWCWDWYGDYTTSSPYTDYDTRGPSSGSYRMTRGGSCFEDASLSQCAARDFLNASSTWQSIGFRLCRGD